MGNESVPIQLARCRFPQLAISNAVIQMHFFQIQYTEAILSNSTRKLLWFEISKMLIAVLENKINITALHMKYFRQSTEPGRFKLCDSRVAKLKAFSGIQQMWFTKRID